MHFRSCDRHQLYDFKERGVDLEVESVRYIPFSPKSLQFYNTFEAALGSGSQSFEEGSHLCVMYFFKEEKKEK